MGETTINIEPSWHTIAEIALMLLADSTNEDGNEKGREIVRDMGERLAAARAQQRDCPEHLKHDSNGETK